MATQFLSDHHLALVARGMTWNEAEQRWSEFDSFENACAWLAQQLTIPETLDGNLEALTQAVDWLEKLDPSHWFAFAPMLQEIRSTSMVPQVLRVTLHLVARCHQNTRLLRQFYLHPWLCEGPDADVATAVAQ